MLEIKNFTKCYTKGKPTVKNISLTVEDGDIFAFVGHNGAGKTTTIKSIVGISNFDEGDILIDGKSIKTNEIECKMKMAYIPDNPDLYEHLKGIDYLNFIADIYKDITDENLVSVLINNPIKDVLISLFLKVNSFNAKAMIYVSVYGIFNAI